MNILNFFRRKPPPEVRWVWVIWPLVGPWRPGEMRYGLVLKGANSNAKTTQAR